MRASALQQLTRRVAQLAPIQRSDRVLLRDLRWAIERVRLLNRQITEIETELRPKAKQYRPLQAIVGVSDVLAAGLVGHAGDSRNLRDAHAFAMRSGTAPVPCSRGRNQHVLVNYFGDRELYRLLWLVAMVQLRFREHPGRQYFDRKRAEGKAPRAAMRCLKRQLVTIIFLCLREDQAALNALVAAPLAA
ncbi:MAG: transposase [Gemmatimonadaceae bacterium]